MKKELSGRQKEGYLNYAYHKIDSIEANMDSLDITLEDIISKNKFKKNPDWSTKSRNNEPNNYSTRRENNNSIQVLNTTTSPMGGRMSDLQKIPELIKAKNSKL